MNSKFVSLFFFLLKFITKKQDKNPILLAGAVGIEPTLEVLETPVLPLYYAPLLCFFM